MRSYEVAVEGLHAFGRTWLVHEGNWVGQIRVFDQGELECLEVLKHRVQGERLRS